MLPLPTRCVVATVTIIAGEHTDSGHTQPYGLECKYISTKGPPQANRSDTSVADLTSIGTNTPHYSTAVCVDTIVDLS